MADVPHVCNKLGKLLIMIRPKFWQDIYKRCSLYPWCLPNTYEVYILTENFPSSLLNDLKYTLNQYDAQNVVTNTWETGYNFYKIFNNTLL